MNTVQQMKSLLKIEYKEYLFQAYIETAIGANGSVRLPCYHNISNGKYSIQSGNRFITGKSLEEASEKLGRILNIIYLEPTMLDHCLSVPEYSNKI